MHNPVFAIKELHYFNPCSRSPPDSPRSGIFLNPARPPHVDSSYSAVCLISDVWEKNNKKIEEKCSKDSCREESFQRFSESCGYAAAPFKVKYNLLLKMGLRLTGAFYDGILQNVLHVLLKDKMFGSSFFTCIFTESTYLQVLQSRLIQCVCYVVITLSLIVLPQASYSSVSSVS